MTFEDIELWLQVKENQQLFKPTNRRPTQQQSNEVFEIANYFEPGKHRPTSCGRCYYNALRAIEKHLSIF